MSAPRVAALRALTMPRAGGDYHDQGADHWITGRMATPMSRYPEYEATRSSFGIDVFGSFIVELELEDGTVGVGVSTGGLPACWIAERHLARFVEGRACDQAELVWDQWRATQF